MAGRHRKQAGSSCMQRDTLPMTPDRVIHECVSTISDIIQRQMERIPRPAKRRTSPRTAADEDKLVLGIPCEVKSSIRSLSEDMRTLFQSVTSLVKLQDEVLHQETLDHGNNTVNSSDACVDELKQQLGTLRNRLQEVEQPHEKSSRDTGRGRKGKKGKGKPTGKLEGSEDPDNKTDLVNQPMEMELGQKVSSTYRAAQDLGATSGKTDSLSCLGKVLSELDGLLAYIESGQANSEQEAKEVELSGKRAELELNNRPDTERKNKEQVTKSGLEVKGNTLGESSNREAASRARCTDTRSETLKETKTTSHRRGKISDRNLGSKTVETQKTSSGREKGGCVVGRVGHPVNTELNSEANCEGVDCLGQSKSKHLRTTPVVSATSKISDKDLVELPSVNDTVDSNHDLLLGNKSKSDTETSFDQKMRPKEDSSGCENSLTLNRRSSVTDLQAYVHTAEPPTLSPPLLDMMPVSTTSCPDISWSPTATVKQLSNCMTSSRFVQFEQPRHVKMATFLGLAWIYVAVMAAYHMTSDISHAPFTAYAETVNGYVSYSLDVLYNNQPWF